MLCTLTLLILCLSLPVHAAETVHATEPMLARLTFWVAPENMAEFERAYKAQVAPLLEKHGLTPSTTDERATVDRAFCRLFEFAAPLDFVEKQEALLEDSSLVKVKRQLGRTFGTAGEDGSIRSSFLPYAGKLGAGRTVRMGRGARRGQWHSYSMADGLPSQSVDNLIQDRAGNLWGVSDYGFGIFRYDGARITTFTTSDGLADEVYSILEDREGRLWFAYDWRNGKGGISRYDGEQIATFTAADGLADNRVFEVMEDRDGTLWFATAGGINLYDDERFAKLDAGGRTFDDVQRLFQDRAGNIWIGSRTSGLTRYDGETFTTFTVENGLPAGSDRDGKLYYVITGITEDQDGNLWLSSYNRLGLTRYDGETFTTFTVEDGLAGSSVDDVLVDREGYVWAAIYGGISRYDGAPEVGASRGDAASRFVNFTPSDGLTHDTIRDVFEDRNGNLWFCTGGGLSRYEGKQFHNFTSREALLSGAVMSVGQNKEGQVFFGSWTGTSYYDGRQFTTTDSLAVTDHIWSILEDSRGRLWFGGFRQDPVSYLENGKFSTFATAEGLLLWGVSTLAEDSQGRLWFGGKDDMEGNEGLRSYDGNELRTFTTADGLAHNKVIALLVDRAGNLWIGTAAGLSRYDGTSEAGASRRDAATRFVNFTVADGLVHNNISALLEDKAGNIWVGTDAGVNRYDGANWTNFTRADGLSGDRVMYILEDRHGVLWFGLWDGGVSRYDGLVFQTLSMRDGLVHDAVQEMLEDRHGDVWIATEGGITRYRPMPGTPAIEVARVLSDRDHGPLEELRLSSAQDYLAFECRGSSFNTPSERLVYVHRLQGYDETWRWSKEAQIVYHDLPTGEYVFQVKAVDRDLNYSEEAATVKVVVHLPYGQIGLVAGLLLAVLGMAIAARAATQRRRERDQARQELVQERRQRIEVQPHEIEAWTLDDFVDQSPAMQLLFDEIRRLQEEGDSRVLISGEAGTGKELIARALHAGSARSGAFVPVRCATLPADVAQSLAQRTEALSQLFGHTPGAFAGADTQRDGYVQQAAAGTLFFDEVSLLPLPLQSHLLRVLTQREVRRLGAETTERIDVRVLAATSMDLSSQVQSNAFSADLYEYLAPHTVSVPPLRERVEDIALLAEYFAQTLMQQMGRTGERLDAGVVAQLEDYALPGNVRELKNIIERALIESGGRPIEAKHLHFLS